ncbi:MAG TPA: hypothetical protein VL284_17890 [Thermoanaerobaculia bacterium]|nr:hypothetical protein [Thermoanaerobaculia bacterium]
MAKPDGFVADLIVVRRALSTVSDGVEVLPERVRAEWNEVLNDSSRDVGIAWRVHRKSVNARPLLQRHFHEHLLKIRRMFGAEMQTLRSVIAASVPAAAALELQRRWPPTDLDAFPFLDASAVLGDVPVPCPPPMPPGVMQRHAFDELRRRCEPLFATPLRGYGIRLRDWARRRFRAVANPYAEIAAVLQNHESN